MSGPAKVTNGRMNVFMRDGTAGEAVVAAVADALLAACKAALLEFTETLGDLRADVDPFHPTEVVIRQLESAIALSEKPS